MKSKNLEAKKRRNQKKETKKPRKKRGILGWILFSWFIFLIGLAAIPGIFYLTTQGYFGEMPDVKDLENPDIFISSEVISADGKVMAKFEREKRTPVDYQDLPDHLVKLLLAKEDERFHDHTGIDAKATARAIIGAVQGKSAETGGGSTITQQLAKQLFTKKRSDNKIERVGQKLREWVLAVQLEKLYTKEEIIAMYLNKFDFLYGAKGIESASKVYFNKTTKDLTPEESAVFIAMLRSPWLYNPLRKNNLEGAKKERDIVLRQLNLVFPEEYDLETVEQWKARPLHTDRQFLSAGSESYSAYFKYALRRQLLDYIEEYNQENKTNYDLYRDGLKIYISLDSRMQELAEKAVEKHLRRLQRTFFAEHKYNRKAPFYNISNDKIGRIMLAAMRRTWYYKTLKEKGIKEDSIIKIFEAPRDSIQLFTWDGPKYEKDKSLMDSIRYHKHILQSGLMSMNPTDGTIKAWVGGINWDYFKYDHVYQARRQVGSTFKPFVYATAINQANYTPCNRISNAKFEIGGWRPRNANGRYGGTLDLRTALAFSTNVVTARLISQTGSEPVIQLARDMGVESPINKDFTIALGSADLTVYEMVGAMSTFANGGIYVKPELILRVEDRNGKIIKEHRPVTREVFSADVAYTMLDLMKGVVKRGTAKRLSGYGIRSEVAAKTGTTNDNSDGWFMGLTPNLVTGVWVGAEDRFAHFRSTGQGQGAATALPIWGYYMREVYKQPKTFGVSAKDKFEKPEGIDERWDCENLVGFNTWGNLGEFGGFGGGDSGGGQTVIVNSGESNVNDELIDTVQINFDE